MKEEEDGRSRDLGCQLVLSRDLLSSKLLGTAAAVLMGNDRDIAASLCLQTALAQLLLAANKQARLQLQK